MPEKSSRQNAGEKLFLILVTALALVAGVGSWFAAAAFSRHDQLHGILPDKERTLGDFSLTDESGRTVTRTEFDGKILVVSFLFTGCALTCPEVTKRMAEIQRLTAASADVRLVSLTVDPRSDTPPVLARWGARFGADTNRWCFLTGSKTVLHALIAKSFLAQDNSVQLHARQFHRHRAHRCCGQERKDADLFRRPARRNACRRRGGN
jgi:cytochrome oxidase Cu insertion factor (SCO1/SenC/PrrC family)